MQVVEVDIGDKKLRSGVQIEKCRYLETSGCTGLCVNSCKMPTQYFFTTELGYDLPLLHYISLWRTLHFFEHHPATCKMCSPKCYMANMICRFAAHQDVTIMSEYCLQNAFDNGAQLWRFELPDDIWAKTAWAWGWPGFKATLFQYMPNHQPMCGSVSEA